MKQYATIVILAVISVCSLGYIGFTSIKSSGVGPDKAKTIAEDFVNKTLLANAGYSVQLGQVTEENGLYKIPVTLPDNSQIDSYMTKDGTIFFSEGLNIEEISNEQNNNLINNQANQMELKTEIITEGTGDQVVKSGDSITVDYTGTLEDGTQFDSSVGKEPFTFTIGQGTVIQGWDQGLLGMKVGEERKLTIPADMAYGSNSVGSIPANSTLIFTVKLISIN